MIAKPLSTKTGQSHRSEVAESATPRARRAPADPSAAASAARAWPPFVPEIEAARPILRERARSALNGATIFQCEGRTRIGDDGSIVAASGQTRLNATAKVAKMAKSAKNVLLSHTPLATMSYTLRYPEHRIPDTPPRMGHPPANCGHNVACRADGNRNCATQSRTAPLKPEIRATSREFAPLNPETRATSREFAPLCRRRGREDRGSE